MHIDLVACVCLSLIWDKVSEIILSQTCLSWRHNRIELSYIGTYSASADFSFIVLGHPHNKHHWWLFLLFLGDHLSDNLSLFLSPSPSRNSAFKFQGFPTQPFVCLYLLQKASPVTKAIVIVIYFILIIV